MTTRTALVTGATSGLGLEAAAQLAASGYGRIVITGRTAEKAEAAHRSLVERNGDDVFETVLVDVADPESVDAAVEDLLARGHTFNALVLNAGMAGHSLRRNANGIEETHAASLTGHHTITMALLAAGRLAQDASIAIVGSEAATGHVPAFGPSDLEDLADETGSLESAAERLLRDGTAGEFKTNEAYSNAKLFVAWWAAALARRLPDTMRVNAVSPGSVPDTDFVSKAPWFMRNVMVPVLKAMPKRMGMAAPVDVGARRYLDVLEMTDSNGAFYASPPKKMTGPLHRVDQPHITDEASQEAAWSAVTRLTGARLPAAA